MKYLKMLGLAAVAAMAMTAFAAGSASATTLEVNGVTLNQSLTITMSLAPESSTLFQPTGGGALANTCKKLHVHGATTTFTGHEVSGPLSFLSFGECQSEPVTVVKPGELRITHIAGTTNGTVSWVGAEVKIPSPIGTLTCRTGTGGVDIGTLTGATTAGNPGLHARMDINAVINCGFFLPSMEWKGEYIVTSPTELGVSA